MALISLFQNPLFFIFIFLIFTIVHILLIFLVNIVFNRIAIGFTKFWDAHIKC